MLFGQESKMRKVFYINGEPRRGYLNGEFWLGPAGIILGRQLVNIAIASPLIVV